MNNILTYNNNLTPVFTLILSGIIGIIVLVILSLNILLINILLISILLLVLVLNRLTG